MSNRYASLTYEKAIEEMRQFAEAIPHGIPDLEINQPQELNQKGFAVLKSGLHVHNMCLIDLQLCHNPDLAVVKALSELKDKVFPEQAPSGPETMPAAASDEGQPASEQSFIQAFNFTAQAAHDQMRAAGFWDKDRNDGEFIALCHSELSEGLEGLRHGNPPSDKIPDFNCAEEELADVILRIMDMAVGRGWRVAEAVVVKAAYNKTRAHKHGGKNF